MNPRRDSGVSISSQSPPPLQSSSPEPEPMTELFSSGIAIILEYLNNGNTEGELAVLHRRGCEWHAEYVCITREFPCTVPQQVFDMHPNLFDLQVQSHERLQSSPPPLIPDDGTEDSEDSEDDDDDDSGFPQPTEGNSTEEVPAPAHAELRRPFDAPVAPEALQAQLISFLAAHPDPDAASEDDFGLYRLFEGLNLGEVQLPEAPEAVQAQVISFVEALAGHDAASEDYFGFDQFLEGWSNDDEFQLSDVPEVFEAQVEAILATYDREAATARLEARRHRRQNRRRRRRVVQRLIISARQQRRRITIADLTESPIIRFVPEVVAHLAKLARDYAE